MKKLILIEVMIMVAGGLFFWNTWIFGWLNHGLAGYTQMSISELNVAGQPYASFFSLTEWLSGLLLLIGASAVALTIRKAGCILVCLILVSLIGALTIFDATHPVDCNQYHNPACVIKSESGLVSNNDKEHGVESIITNYVTVLLALVLLAWALIRKMSGGEVATIELLLMVVLAIGVIASLIIRRGVAFDSITERVWNTLVSFEFLYVAYRVLQLTRNTHRL